MRKFVWNSKLTKQKKFLKIRIFNMYDEKKKEEREREQERDFYSLHNIKKIF